MVLLESLQFIINSYFVFQGKVIQVMIHQRKRFNYLSGLTRGGVTENDKHIVKAGCIVSSNLNSQHNKQSLMSSQYSTSRTSGNSSTIKYQEPLSEIQNNIPTFNQGKSSTKLFSTSKKENFSQQILQHSSGDKQNLFSLFPSKKQTQKELQQKILLLQQQKMQIITQTEEKFIQMEKHLEKVQKILKEKEQTIERLTQDNRILKQLAEEHQLLKQQIQHQQYFKTQLQDQKQEILRIVADKNKVIQYMNNQIQQFQANQTEMLNKIKSLTEQNQLVKSQNLSLQAKLAKSTEQIQVQTQSYEKQSLGKASLTQSATYSQQTDLTGEQIQELLQKINQNQSKIDYRRKYESIFKQALQMEDQVYRLKEQLFDAQAQSKILQQQFSTYKLLYQIQQISQKSSSKTS